MSAFKCSRCILNTVCVCVCVCVCLCLCLCVGVHTCRAAIEEGKAIYYNIRNFVRFQLST